MILAWGVMPSGAFKDLNNALTQSSDWAVIDHAWQECEGLMNALAQVLSADLLRQVVQVRRSDPPRGVRGSQLTVIAGNSAAAAKIRLTLSDFSPALRAQGWGIQEIKVVAQRIQDITAPAVKMAPRGAIPEAVRLQLQELANDCANDTLRNALRRISKRRRQ